MKTIYLAGGIAGLSWRQATSWRLMAAELLNPMQTLDPLRPWQFEPNTEPVSQLFCNSNFAEPDTPPEKLVARDSLFTRDYADIDRCDMIFVNFIGATRKSIGTTCEIARGRAFRKPIICAMEPGNPNEDAFLLWNINERYDTLKEAINRARGYFGYPPFDAGDGDD